MGFIVGASLALLGLLMAVPAVWGDFVTWQLGLFLLYGIAAQGVGLAWGRGGFLPLGNALFFGVSGYASAMILHATDGALVPNLLAIVVCAAILAALAWGLAMLVFQGRLESGPYFSLITLALVLIVEQLAETAQSLTGGFNGYSGYPSIAGLDPFGNLYYLIAGLVVVTTFCLMLLEKLPAGLVLRGLVSQEARLQTLGFATHRVKAWVFALSAFITALAGALFASHQGIVTPQASGFVLSSELLIWAAVGGRLHPLGSLLGAVAIGFLSAELRDTYLWWEVLIAFLFLAVVIAAPGGAIEMLSYLAQKLGWRPHELTVAPNPPPPTRPNNAAGALTLRDVHVSAGEIRILDGLEFTCPTQGFLCVIGPNGAGKTTMLKSITGAMKVERGEVSLGGQTVTNLPQYRALSNGIGRKMQIPTVFEDLSVRENLQLASLANRARAIDYFRVAPLGWEIPELSRLLDQPGVPLRELGDLNAGALPQGHRQMLELCLTLTPAPAIVLLDEPTAGMSPEETALMVRLIKKYQLETKAFVLVIEHDMALVQALDARVLVLHQGRRFAEGSFGEIRSDPRVAEVYTGGNK